MTDFDLRSYLGARADEVELALERVAERLETELPDTLAAAAGHGILSGGKHLRPILCHAAYRACGGEAPDRAVHDFAVSLEMIHGYSLMHDDLPSMDDAELRRGKPTTHRAHGVEATTTAGALLIPLAARQALEGARALGADEATAQRAATVLMEAAGAGGMVGGQGLDLMGEGQRLGIEDLNELHRHKTGALLAASLRMGAIAAGAPQPLEVALTSYGRAIGLAFQIADDVLDATASAEELGKNPSDADLDKSTYVSLFGLEEARNRGKAEVQDAKTALSGAGIASEALEALADYIVERGH